MAFEHRVGAGTPAVPVDRDRSKSLDLRSLFPSLAAKTAQKPPRQKPLAVKDLAVICRQLNTLLEAGVPVLRALQVLSLQQRTASVRELLQDTAQRVERGDSLADALRPHQHLLPPTFISVVEAADRMARQFEREAYINEKLQGVLLYPKILVVVTLGVTSFLLGYVVPSFADPFQNLGHELPAITRLVLGAGEAVSRFWWLLLLVLGGAYLAYRRALLTPEFRSKIDGLALRVPVIGPLQRTRETMRFSRVLASLLDSGIPLVQAMRLCSRTLENSQFRDAVLTASNSVEQGTSMMRSLTHNGVFSPMMLEMIRVGDESGRLSALLDQTATYYENELEHAIQRLLTTLEPLLMLGLGAVIAFVVIAVYLPMFTATTHS